MKIATAATLTAARLLTGASAHADDEPAASPGDELEMQNVCTGSIWFTTPQCCGDAILGMLHFIGLYCETCTLWPHRGVTPSTS